MNSITITSNFTSVEGLNILEGTTPLEVYGVTFFVPLCSLVISTSTTTSNVSDKAIAFIEAICINLTLLLALTLLSDYLLLLFTSLFMIVCYALAYMYFHITRDQLHRIKKSIFQVRPLDEFNKKFIGDYRGHLLLATALSILGVDFAVYPERFSKTETYGWSIMDAGVGSFVLVHGLCSSSARKSAVQQDSLKKCILSSFPLFILGVVRLAATTAVGYHKVVPEYGIHWSFFFTLSIIKVLCYFISVCFHFIRPGFLALIVLAIHQTLLSKGVTEFILSESRRNLFEANKEGICSLLGFVAIYFFGVQLGEFLWRKRNKISEFIYIFIKIVVLGVLGWCLMYVIHIQIQPVSRRMANFAYCIWVVTLTSLQISIHLAHQIINFFINQVFQKDVSNCLLWNAINYNGLFYFLFSNLMTGLVNLSIKTENYGAFLAFLILVLYITVVTIPVIICYQKSIQLKFW